MILRHRNRGILVPLAIAFAFCATANSLSIRREPMIEQVLVITTDASLQDENPTEVVETTTTPQELYQRDQEAGVTEETIVVADSTGESWEVDPTVSSIVSKDVEIEIKDGSNSNMVSKLKETEMEPDSSKPILPEIYSFHVQSDVKYRYSRTYVTSRVANKDAKRAHEVTFSVVLPETAFISKFIMEIDGKAYEAYVKEKEEAKKDYQQAQSLGQSAGLVEKSTRNSNVFNVNVNVKPSTKVTFNLTYEELLTRRLGRYEQAININPDQVSSIKDYQIVVNIEESRNLSFVRVPSLSNDIEAQDPSGNNPDAVIDRPAPNKAKISWSPNTADQKKLVKEGISGKFIVQYDVDREADGGQILVMQGYFVHFFAPENLPPLKKHVVFILDISGSMWGRKMEQLKESQKKILDDLTPDDYFNIITFSSDVYLWSPNDITEKTSARRNRNFYQASGRSELTPPELASKKQPLPATAENIQKAKAFIDSLVASGGTNIHDAIIEALNLTSVIKEAQRKASNPTTEQDLIDTTVFPSTTSVRTTVVASSAKTDNVQAYTPGTSSSTTTSSTTANPSSTDAEEDEENRTVVILDIAKSELGGITDKPEDVTTMPSFDGITILPPNVQSLIIFLTDGEPTVGVTDPPEIQKLIQVANRNLSIPIFSLGFGEGADFPFLKKLSLQNYGFGRKIYEASDAALQLKGFYNEIASPLLANVKFNYTSEEYNVTDLTVIRFPTVFNGTEIAVAGKLVAPPKPERVDEEDTFTTISPSNDAEVTTEVGLNDETPGFDAPIQPDRLSIACDFEPSDRYYLDVSIEGNGRDGEVDLHNVEFYDRRKCGVGIEFPIAFVPSFVYPPRPTPPPTPEDQFLERLWAYLTIQQLLEQDLAQGDAGADDSDNAIDATPSSTVAPDDSTFVTKVLPVQATTPTPKTNSSKTETPKQRALRLALKYGFVTPLTSLVVVKPNSSDVTDAVPTDGRPIALDSVLAQGRFSFSAPILTPKSSPHSNRMANQNSIGHTSIRTSLISGGPLMSKTSARRRTSQSYSNSRSSYSSNPMTHSMQIPQRIIAPQSLSSAFAAAPSLMSIRNKIASHPLPLPIHSNYQQLSRPVPFGGGASYGSYGGPPGGFGAPSPPQLSIDYDDSSSVQLAPSPPVRVPVIPTRTTTIPPSTTTTSSLTLNDITWLNGTNDVIRLNETDYTIARQPTSDDSAGYDCTVKNSDQGKCSHLKDCVLPAFVNDQELFRSSYFCSIQSTATSVSYAGVCCPSRRSRILLEP